MKKIIIILFTVVLGIYMGSVLIIGDSGSNSLKGGADSVVKTINSKITGMDSTIGN